MKMTRTNSKWITLIGIVTISTEKRLIRKPKTRFAHRSNLLIFWRRSTHVEKIRMNRWINDKGNNLWSPPDRTNEDTEQWRAWKCCRSRVEWNTNRCLVKNWFRNSTYSNYSLRETNKQLRIASEEGRDSTRTVCCSPWYYSSSPLQPRESSVSFDWKKHEEEIYRRTIDLFDWRESIGSDCPRKNQSILDRSSKWSLEGQNSFQRRARRERLEWSDWCVEIPFLDHTSSKWHNWTQQRSARERQRRLIYPMAINRRDVSSTWTRRKAVSWRDWLRLFSIWSIHWYVRFERNDPRSINKAERDESFTPLYSHCHDPSILIRRGRQILEWLKCRGNTRQSYW